MSVYTVRVEHGRRRPDAEIPESGPVTPPYLHHPSEVSHHKVVIDTHHPDGREKTDWEMDNEARHTAYDMATATMGQHHDNDMVTKADIIHLEAARASARFRHFVLPEDPQEAHRLLTSVQHTAAPINPPETGDYDHNRLHDLVANGGFTSHPWRDSPTHGFMASLDSHVAPGEVHHVSTLTPDHIAAHRASIQHHLLKPGVFQGGWHDTATGDVYLDTSMHHHSENMVRRFAVGNKQKAYYDLGSGQEKFLDPHLDPQKHADPEGWAEKYKKVGTEPAEGYHEYAHLYQQPGSHTVTAGKEDPWYASASDAEIDEHPAAEQIHKDIAMHVTPNGKAIRLVKHTGRMVTAHSLPSGRRIGGITWFGGKHDPENPSTTKGVTHKVVVSGPYRRKGIATAMLAHARATSPGDDIKHTTALTDDGRAWAEKTAMAGGPTSGEIHRGVRLRMNDDEHAHFHALSPEHKAHYLMAKADDKSGGLGMHWTDDHDTAAGFADPDQQGDSHRHPHDVSVMFHGTHPGPEHEYPHGNAPWGRKIWDHEWERETPLNPGAPVKVHSVSWADARTSHIEKGVPLDRQPRAWKHHDFDEPVQRHARRNYDSWRPHARIFGPGKHGEDPRLFEGEHLKDEVRDNIITTLDTYWAPKYGHQWVSWAKVYFTGSEASHWYGNNDFDVLIGIDYDEFRKDTKSTLQNEEIDDLLNKGFRADLNDDVTFAGDTFGRTWYVNPNSYDITRLKPYAAYDVVDDFWAVHPVHVPDDWGPDKFPDSTWHMAEHYADEIDRISHLDPKTRQQYAERLFDHIHTDRQRAFSDRGTGVFDVGNVAEKYLDQRPDHPLALLVEMKNAGKESVAKEASAETSESYAYKHVVAQPAFGGKRYGDSIDHPSQQEIYEAGPNKAMDGAHTFEHQYTHKGTPVAKLRYSVHPDEPQVLNIEGLAVHPDHQKSGLAVRMIDKMQEHAKKHGMKIDHGTYTDQGHAFSRKYMKSDHYDPDLHLPYPEKPTETTGEDFLPHMLDEHEMQQGRKTAHRAWVHYYANIPNGWEHEGLSTTADMAGIIGGADDDTCSACSGSGEQGTGHECYACDGSGTNRDPEVDNANLQNGLLVGRDDARGIKPVEAAVRHAPGADGEPADGIMIALVPPHRVLRSLPLPPDGEHYDNLHITLAYLGKVAEYSKEQVRDLPELIAAWAETQPKLDARIQGSGTFANPGSHVLWAAADIPGGNHMYVSLVDTLKEHGYSPRQDHGWTPHLTLSYEDHHVRFLPKIEPQEFRVREVWCCIRGRWESFPLKG